MPKFIVSLQSGADYEATTREIKKQGGSIVDDSMKIIGMITVQMSDEGASSLKSLSSDIISVEPDQEVTIQAA
ncbi:uncharacterized protein F5147DRAFT_767257 [Suillus discolor]|uniref:Inhibitor I9 domain-containing protein n=1 Tax=Suillus discolor TaxID=1912936 RepID=A0A9P7FIS3_9AGAM|nr:uncharacterized protein F5147DRAFT_767257 [Suillus discolor]KAG2119783.1 hypothetical protein F5147DRAFT_767257 [Suillus discolor]